MHPIENEIGHLGTDHRHKALVVGSPAILNAHFQAVESAAADQLSAFPDETFDFILLEPPSDSNIGAAGCLFQAHRLLKPAGILRAGFGRSAHNLSQTDLNEIAVPATSKS